MMKRSCLHLFYFILVFFLPVSLMAQIMAPGATGTDQTNYPVFSGTDNIYIFCAENEGAEMAALQVSTELEGTKTFLWEKYNESSASFDFYFSESSSGQTSQISGLADGCYRATVSLGGTTEIYRAWAFNNWITVSGEEVASSCESFKMEGRFTTATLVYYDLSNNASIEIFKDMKVQWEDGSTTVSSVLSPEFFDLPSQNTNYTFTAFDRFGCSASTNVFYESIVPEAKFSVDYGDQANANDLEAPLTVSFINESQNADPGQYEWFFFRDLNEIKKEAEGSQQAIDSIMVVAYDDSPVYTYENTGTYMVKMVAKKVTELNTCVDTFYLDDYIKIDSSYIRAANVFTPNGDGVNDVFVVKFFSMKSVKISIFNRWGKKVHYWSKSDVQGFEDSFTESVWDGKIGGRYASPGVYYYVVEGSGRDGEKRRAHGFVHLFRGKD